MQTQYPIREKERERERDLLVIVVIHFKQQQKKKTTALLLPLLPHYNSKSSRYLKDRFPHSSL